MLNAGNPRVPSAENLHPKRTAMILIGAWAGDIQMVAPNLNHRPKTLRKFECFWKSEQKTSSPKSGLRPENGVAVV